MSSVELKCSFCGKSQREVRKLIAGPKAFICDECLGLANDLLAEELKHDARDERRGGLVERPLAVIPARIAATRFPGKPLAKIAGKPMVQHVYERCVESGAFSEVIIATDSDEIIAAARGFGGNAAMTSPTCASGTDRVAQIAAETKAPLIVNVQGDEPAIHPKTLRAVAEALKAPGAMMTTAVRPLKEDERGNPNVVKVALGDNGYALYFSRADIPYPRADVGAKRWAHLGVYGYRADILAKLSKLPPTSVERTESLEQLRALENGIRIYCAITEHASVGVDRPEDVPLAEALLKELDK